MVSSWLGSAQFTAKHRRWGRWPHVRESGPLGIAHLFSSQFSLLSWVPKSSSWHLKIFTFFPTESVQIFDTYFCVKTKTLQVDLSQTEDYFEVIIPNSYRDKKFFPKIYNFPMFEIVCKKSHFSIQFVKLRVKVYIVLSVRPTRAQNQDLRSPPDLFRRNESNGDVKIGKWVFIENHIFFR